MALVPLSLATVAGLPPSALVIGVLLAGLLLGLFIARWRTQRRMNVNRRTGSRGEDIALALLERAGFEIVSTQAGATISVEVDNVTETYRVRADAIVRKQGREFLVEMKGTSTSADIGNRQTRRQLLEYAVAFEVDECLLVNAEDETIQIVRFPSLYED